MFNKIVILGSEIFIFSKNILPFYTDFKVISSHDKLNTLSMILRRNTTQNPIKNEAQLIMKSFLPRSARFKTEA